MLSRDHERLDVISATLADILHHQKEFDQRLARIEAALHLPKLQTPSPVPPEPKPEPETLAPRARGPEVRDRRLETSIGLALVNRIGAITLVLGVGFFFKWAVDNNWIGPSGQVILGLLAGVVAITAADLFWRLTQPVFAQGITATGISIIYLALYAAFDVYQLLPHSLAFVAMFLTTVLSGGLALRYNSLAIAALGLFGGFVTPYLLDTREDHPWYLFSYVLLLDICALILVRARGWRMLEFLSSAGTTVLYVGWLASHSKEKFPAIFFILVFYGLYAVAGRLQPVFLVMQVIASLVPALVWQDPLPYFTFSLPVAAAGLYVAHLHGWPFAPSFAFFSFWAWTGLVAAGSQHLGGLFLGLTLGFLLFVCWIFTRHRRLDKQALVILAVDGAAYFGIAWSVLHSDYRAWMGLFAAAIGAVYAGVAYMLWRREPDQPKTSACLLSIGMAISFVTLAIPIQLSSYRVTLAWALEATAITWICSRFRYRRTLAVSITLFTLVLIRLLAIDAWDPGPGRFPAFLVAAVSLWLAAVWLYGPHFVLLGYYAAGHMAMLWGLTQVALDWSSRGIETFSVSILWAVYAIIFVAIGVATRTAINRIAGLTLMGVVVLKVYLFDVWQLSRIYWTLAFVVLGIILLSTSFLYSRFRALIESLWRDDHVKP
jgi:uncharacterized membrane protein